MTQDWQLVLIAWGTKYGTEEIALLVQSIRRRARGLARVVLITDRPRPGLKRIEQVPFPPEFLDEPLRRGGCQAKLAMFKPGVVPPDLPAIFVDLDTVVLGDLSRLLAVQRTPHDIAMLQSAILPFGAFARWLYRVTGGKRYARGNSSIVVFHPAHCGFVAERFMQLYRPGRPVPIRPMVADERFVSWVAQPHMRAVPASLAVKFPTEFMYPWLWLGRLRAALPWVRARRAGLVAITLPGEAVKAEALLALPEGAEVADAKGRRMIWSDAWLGPVRQRLLAHFGASAGS